jgi:hypothetical protein
MKISEWITPLMIALVASVLPTHATAAQETATSVVAGTGIYAELNGGVDSKKAKAGDAITLHTTEAVKSSDDRMILPKGTKVIGHVTQSEAEAKGANKATLGLAFDKALLKDGHEVPLNVIVQAIGAPVSHSVDPGASPPESGVAQGTVRSSPMGGRSASTASQPPTSGVSAGATVPDVNPQGQLGPSSHGVVGMHGLTLNRATANNTLVAVVTSDGKNVHLDSGTRFLLVEQNAEYAGAVKKQD